MEESSLIKEDILIAFHKVLPYMPHFFENEISIAITDNEKFLFNQICKSLPLKIELGAPIPEGGAASQAIISGNVIIKEVSKEIYGAPFRSYAVPLYNSQKKVVGSVLVAKNLQRSKELMDIAKKLTSAFGVVTNAVNELQNDIQKLAVMNSDIAEKSEKATEYADGTNDVLNFIHKISSQTNLLGLNASIEAARAGDRGRGFQIVAEEIRKMSGNTIDSVKKINNVLKELGTSVNDISGSIKESNSIFRQQIAILQEINASMTGLNDMIQTLEKLSKEI